MAMALDEKMGVAYFDILKTSSEVSTSNMPSSQPYQPGQQHSLSESILSETLSQRSGFGRDSFSTPEGHIPVKVTIDRENASLSHLVE